MTDSALLFPPGFLWGAATSAYQIEGAWDIDGRGETIWDTFTSIAGNVKGDATGDVTCDHYRRWRDDVALMKSLNLSVYRFSIAWSRILPDGRGAINPRGLDFYSALVDGLLEAGITPFVTLYHFDLPQALENEGGWLRRGISGDFAAYADVVARKLGDRVKHWITLNEPWVFSWLGYGYGTHAPGKRSNTPAQPLLAAHNALLAHGAAVQALRAAAPAAHVGISNIVTHVDPASARAVDLKAAARYDGFYNRWFLDPLFRGHYPADMLELWEEYLPDIETDDMQQIATPLDFLAVGYYTRAVVADDPGVPYHAAATIMPDAAQKTTMGWEVYPQGLYNVLKRLHNEYAPRSLYVIENGAAFEDALDAEGRVRDDARIDFLREHIGSAKHALNDGVPLDGYFAWSLLDNFEWSDGFSQRFGLVSVDYTTQRRIPKDSARWYADLIHKAHL
jgi:beta-glucosidase